MGWIGKKVEVVIDRPLGSIHPKYNDLIYPVNYGFIPKTKAGDGMEQDAYVLGINYPVNNFKGIVVAIIQREDDVEEKLVVAPINKKLTNDEIMQMVNFQERYFKSKIIR